MAFAVHHKDTPVSLFPTHLPLTIVRTTDAAAMATLQSKPMSEMTRRFDSGHRAYTAILNGETAAWGWVATRSAEIGEMGAAFSIPDRERYLWNFVTLPKYRGQGLYPQLLRAILNAEWHEADRFWIAYAPENHASASGIRRAGFVAVAELSFDASGHAALRRTEESSNPTSARLSPSTMVASALRERTDDVVASRMLGLPLVDDVLTPCWRCVRAGRGTMACKAGQCRCDYQLPEQACAP